MLRPEIEYSNNTNNFRINWYDENNEVTVTYAFLIQNEVDENTYEMDGVIRKNKGEKVLPQIVESLESLLTEVANEKGINLKHVETTRTGTELTEYLKKNYVKNGYEYKGVEDGLIILEKKYFSIN